VHLLPSQDQTTIALTAAELLRKELPISTILQRRTADNVISDAAWSSCAQLGLLGLGLPESVGGTGLGLVEETLVFREIGRQLAPGPFLTTVLAGHAAFASGAIELAAELAAGAVRVGYAEPDADASETLSGRVQVRDWAGAPWLLVSSPKGTGLVETAAIGEVHSVRAIDSGLRLGWATAENVPLAQRVPDEALYLRGLVLVAAQLVGVAEACLDASVYYAKTREQFGRPIGVNQAIKHACADMAVAARYSADQLMFAAASAAAGHADARFHAHAAKVLASAAARKNAAANLQVHGGMGFTTEFDAHLYVERAEVLEHTLSPREDCLAVIIAEEAPQ
jgi:alkylation response protein AidB-like acyl-CoA dehydrogenase